VFSRHATGVELLLFDAVDDTKAASVIRLDPSANRTYYYWHACVPDVRPGQLYAYRVDGPFEPAIGLRSIPPRCCWIRTAGASPCPRPTVATLLGGRATTPRPP